MNKAALSGTVAQEPRVFDGERTIVKFTLCAESEFEFNGEMKKSKAYPDITVFGKQADHVKKYLFKGQTIVVEGRVNVSKYTDKDGNVKSSTTVIADQIDFIDWKENDTQQKITRNTTADSAGDPWFEGEDGVEAPF